MFTYIQSETSPDLFTSGHYDPDNVWHPDMDFPEREDAADRVAYLNGELITKKHLSELIKAYAREDQSDGTATYRDIVTDLLHLAKKNIKSLSIEEAIELITLSAADVFRVESTRTEGGSIA